jgi:putative hydrolase of the HAD superfamily
LYIITNGFGEVQETKMKNSGLNKFFNKVITSDTIGIQKPHPAIFHHALSSVHAKKNESLMVGDDIVTDILGAKRAGIDQVLLNPSRKPHNEDITYEIWSLLELKDLL